MVKVLDSVVVDSEQQMEDAGRIAVVTDTVGERWVVGAATMGNMCGQAGRI